MKFLKIQTVIALMLVSCFGLKAQDKIDPDLAAKLGVSSLSNSNVSGILVLQDQADLYSLQTQFTTQETTRKERHEQVVRALQEKAEMTQGPLMGQLKGMKGVSKVTSLWIVNALIVEASPEVFYEMAKSSALEGLYLDYPIETILPIDEGPVQIPTAVDGEPGLRNINAHLLWADGITGAGRLVSHLDTGVDGNHPALNAQWRGNQPGVTPQEAWFDPLTNTTFPFDAGSHGTHTMGTIVGRDGADIIGVAYDAQWISAGVIDRGGINATIQNALLAFQWSADPDGNPATVDDVPDVSSNSWGIPLSFLPGCDQTFWQAIDNMEAATVVAVFAAGNEGSTAQTIRTPADRNTSSINAFSVGALGTDGATIASYSSRGPSRCTGANLIKPEVVARGSSVRSSVPGAGYSSFNGTSMATPHVAGAVALLRQVNPNATVAQIKNALMNSAVDLGANGDDNVYGNGRIDVHAAAQLLQPSCPANVLVTQPITSSQTVSASNSIIASSTVAGNASVSFEAGSLIRLLPGFQTAATTGNFNASIVACSSFASDVATLNNNTRSTTIQSEVLSRVDEGLALFPNPTTGKITMKYPFQEYGEYHVRVYDFSGKLAIDSKLEGMSDNLVQLNLGHFKEGLFTLQLILPSGESIIRRVVVEK